MSYSIRHDYRKPTNGPILRTTFSDCYPELNEMICRATESRLCFYAFRRPHDVWIESGTSESAVRGIGIQGFVIGRFDPELSPLTIPYDPVQNTDRDALPDVDTYSFPTSSTTEAEHTANVSRAVGAIRNGHADKIVLARTIVRQGHVDVAQAFMQLSETYPDAYVYAFSTPETGCWIGATPELLLMSRADKLTTMALAGTRRAGADGPWDCKNTAEQQMVARHIVDWAKENGLQESRRETKTLIAGNVEHICTDFTFVRNIRTKGDVTPAQDLVCTLSPTPAVCGLPRNAALDAIGELENFDRGCYGGFCGRYQSPTVFSIYVNLRCALIEENRYAVFAGGGITAESDPESEWRETELKAAPLLHILSTSSKND